MNSKTVNSEQERKKSSGAKTNKAGSPPYSDETSNHSRRLAVYQGFVLEITQKKADQFQGLAFPLENGEASIKAKITLRGSSYDYLYKELRNVIDSSFPPPSVSASSVIHKSIATTLPDSPSPAPKMGIPRDGESSHVQPTAVNADQNKRGCQPEARIEAVETIMVGKLDLLIEKSDRIKLDVQCVEDGIDKLAKALASIGLDVGDIKREAEPQLGHTTDDMSTLLDKFSLTLPTNEDVAVVVGRLDAIQSQIDSRIDLKDAEAVLKLRDELETFVKASIVQTLSKQLMPSVEQLVERAKEVNPEVEEMINDLAMRCRRAGLLNVENIFG